MNRGTYFWGGILVLFGVLFLLSNLGLLGDINLWGAIGPLFLILIGLWLILGMVFKPGSKAELVEIPLQGLRTAALHINHGAGRLKISSGAGITNLLEGSFRGGVDRKDHQQEDHFDLTLSVPSHFFFWSWGSYGLNWDIKLNSQVTLDLDVNFGAGESRMDLSDLDINHLVLKTGVSGSDIILPSREGITYVRIESGISGVNLHVPQDVAARIKTETGLAGVTIDRQRFPRQGGVSQSPEYDSAMRKIEIKISTGIGAVDIR
jgi:Cell wall-active antibiotics response LiaF, C-terminal/LiaF transmembrane domain